MATYRPPHLNDGEEAFRLLRPGAIQRDGALSSAVFSEDRPSVYIKSRLPDHDGEQLHICKFKDYGRGRLLVGDIRSARDPGEFDVLLTGEAEHPHEAFGDAHAEVTGPCRTRSGARKLRDALRERGVIEKLPPKELWGT